MNTPPPVTPPHRKTHVFAYRGIVGIELGTHAVELTMQGRPVVQTSSVQITRSAYDILSNTERGPGPLASAMCWKGDDGKSYFGWIGGSQVRFDPQQCQVSSDFDPALLTGCVVEDEALEVPESFRACVDAKPVKTRIFAYRGVVGIILGTVSVERAKGPSIPGCLVTTDEVQITHTAYSILNQMDRGSSLLNCVMCWKDDDGKSYFGWIGSPYTIVDPKQCRVSRECDIPLLLNSTVKDTEIGIPEPFRVHVDDVIMRGEPDAPTPPEDPMPPEDDGEGDEEDDAPVPGGKEETDAHRSATARFADAFRQFSRNGRWGTCANCPRDSSGHVYPEFCRWSYRYDHWLTIDQLSHMWKTEWYDHRITVDQPVENENESEAGR